MDLIKAAFIVLAVIFGFAMVALLVIAIIAMLLSFLYSATPTSFYPALLPLVI